MSRQEFHTTDVLRLQVEDAPGALPNIIPNGDGELGGWGWVTYQSTDKVDTFNQPSADFRYLRISGTGVWHFETEAMPVTPGDYIGARLERQLQTVAATDMSMRLDFYDAAGALLSSSAATTITATLATFYIPATLIPASTVTARLRVASSSTVGNAQFDFGQVMVTVAATAGAIPGTYSWIESVNWLDVTEPTIEIGLERAGLQPGVLSAVVADSSLDPASSDTIRPGRKCRLQAYDGTKWETLHLGVLQQAKVDYYLKELAGNPASTKYARIALVSVDATQRAANTPRPYGYATAYDLPAGALEGAEIPYSVNGFGYPLLAYQSPDPVSRNDAASLLDQVVLTRDSTNGYAWVSRRGVLTIWDGSEIPADVVATHEEADYVDIVVSFNTQECINEVTVAYLRYDPTSGETTEVIYGPYRDVDSIREWGQQFQTFKIHGPTDDATLPGVIEDFADVVLAANAVPVLRILEERFTIKTTADIAPGRALIDLYDLIQTTNDLRALDQTARVTRIKHQITGTKWTVDVGYSTDGAVATPQATPPVAALPTGPPWSSRNKSAAQTIATSTITVVTFPIIVGTETGLTYSAGTYTVPRTGRYLINANGAWAGNASGRRLFRILINGSVAASTETNPDDTNAWTQHSAFLAYLTEGDTIAVDCFQTSGGNLNITAANAQISWLGP